MFLEFYTAWKMWMGSNQTLIEKFEDSNNYKLWILFNDGLDDLERSQGNNSSILKMLNINEPKIHQDDIKNKKPIIPSPQRF